MGYINAELRSGVRVALERRRLSFCALAAASLVCGFLSSAANAQAAPVSPSAITPEDLIPITGSENPVVEIPETDALSPPVGAEGLMVALGDVVVDGAFSELSVKVGAVVAQLRNQKVSLAQIYAAASEIEAIHARAGFILARISVPPQTLKDNGTLRLVMVDGFIDDVNTVGIPYPVRPAVAARGGDLTGQRHLKMADIETLLTRVSEIPGLTLRSTLMRGDNPGGARLVLEGQHDPLSGSFSVDNQLDPSLDRWAYTLQLALNSAMGLGEQAYGFVSSDYRAGQLFSATPRVRVRGGGAIVPLYDGNISLNPEATFSQTAPEAETGAPRTIGTLRRLTLRVNKPIFRSQRKSGGLTLTVEQIEERSKLSDFDMPISYDRYMAARVGGSFGLAKRNGRYVGMRIQFSQGLGNLGALSEAAALERGVDFSRQGAGLDFSKLTIGAHINGPVSEHIGLSFDARAQTSFGSAIFRAEQFTLEGEDGLSGYVGGHTAVDTGFSVRSEMSRQIRLGAHAGMVPYVMAAAGSGRLNDVTVLEDASLTLFNLGAGVRIALPYGLGVNVEYTRGMSPIDSFNSIQRVNVMTSLRF